MATSQHINHAVRQCVALVMMQATFKRASAATLRRHWRQRYTGIGCGRGWGRARGLLCHAATTADGGLRNGDGGRQRLRTLVPSGAIMVSYMVTCRRACGQRRCHGCGCASPCLTASSAAPSAQEAPVWQKSTNNQSSRSPTRRLAIAQHVTVCRVGLLNTCNQYCSATNSEMQPSEPVVVASRCFWGCRVFRAKTVHACECTTHGTVVRQTLRGALYTLIISQSAHPAAKLLQRTNCASRCCCVSTLGACPSTHHSERIIGHHRHVQSLSNQP